MKASTQEQVIGKLNPLLRGFANYYRGVISKETFNYISHRIWQYLYSWAKRRHPFHVALAKTGRLPAQVKFQSSPDDPLLHEDWLKRLHIQVARQAKQGKNYWEKGSKYVSCSFS